MSRETREPIQSNENLKQFVFPFSMCNLPPDETNLHLKDKCGLLFFFFCYIWYLITVQWTVLSSPRKPLWHISFFLHLWPLGLLSITVVGDSCRVCDPHNPEGRLAMATRVWARHCELSSRESENRRRVEEVETSRRSRSMHNGSWGLYMLHKFHSPYEKDLRWNGVLLPHGNKVEAKLACTQCV